MCAEACRTNILVKRLTLVILCFLRPGSTILGYGQTHAKQWLDQYIKVRANQDAKFAINLTTLYISGQKENRSTLKMQRTASIAKPKKYSARFEDNLKKFKSSEWVEQLDYYKYRLSRIDKQLIKSTQMRNSEYLERSITNSGPKGANRERRWLNLNWQDLLDVSCGWTIHLPARK